MFRKFGAFDASTLRLSREKSQLISKEWRFGSGLLSIEVRRTSDIFSLRWRHRSAVEKITWRMWRSAMGLMYVGKEISKERDAFADRWSQVSKQSFQMFHPWLEIDKEAQRRGVPIATSLHGLQTRQSKSGESRGLGTTKLVSGKHRRKMRDHSSIGSL